MISWNFITLIEFDQIREKLISFDIAQFDGDKTAEIEFDKSW